ncbi:MAG: hypothetical protein FJ297_19080 [Planctomycetes bacterium]|nr:hypothetical protein [Planctomycetota bacterium]
MTSLFKQVTDEASARQHGPEIRAISARLNGHAAQMKEMDAAKKGMAFASRAAEIVQIQQEMAPELLRISRDAALAAHLGDAMRPPKIN